MKYEVCLSRLGKEVRMPALHLEEAELLAKILKSCYQGWLIEIAHDGIREGR